jgi:enamine deaminase RidA (YjgF/YER057c/UK114 family)
LSGIERFGSGGRWEAAVGYARVVRAGEFVFVAGCTGVGPDGEVVSDDPYEQMRQACANVVAALAQAGATPEQVVRTRMYVRNIELNAEAVGRAHAEAFGAAPPASAMVGVERLISPAMLVEIEAEAFVL